MLDSPLSQPNFPYYNVVDQIYHAEWAAAKLARLELLAESIAALWPQGHPTQLIHVAGTGGKGSTCRFLEMGLSCAGKAGAFDIPVDQIIEVILSQMPREAPAGSAT